MWLLASVIFSIYTANFAKYNETYGTLGSVVVVMLWLFLTALAVIVGAELNAELERQTVRDSTMGAERPMGARDRVCGRHAWPNYVRNAPRARFEVTPPSARRDGAQPQRCALSAWTTEGQSVTLVWTVT